MKPIIVLSLLLSLVSCSKTKDLMDTGRTTKDMSDTTKDMSKTTKDMKQTTDEMNDTTSFMYPQIRTKEAEDTRNKKMKILLDPNTTMAQKIIASTIYFKSFEFQLWTNSGDYDTLEVREELFYEAFIEFFIGLGGIYDQVDPQKMSPLKTDPKKENLEMVLYAISVVMHKNNHHQIENHKRVGGFEVKSFYDLLTTSLIKQQNGENLTEYEAIANTGSNLDLSRLLLESRMNMLLALALKNIVNKDEMPTGDKVSAFFYQLTSGRVGDIEMDSYFESSNKPTMEDTLVKLEAALKTKEDLVKAGVRSPKINPAIKEIFENLKTKKPSTDMNIQSASMINMYHGMIQKIKSF